MYLGEGTTLMIKSFVYYPSNWIYFCWDLFIEGLHSTLNWIIWVDNIIQMLTPFLLKAMNSDPAYYQSIYILESTNNLQMVLLMHFGILWCQKFRRCLSRDFTSILAHLTFWHFRAIMKAFQSPVARLSICLFPFFLSTHEQREIP